MGCCGDGKKEHGSGHDSKGSVNWVQIVAVGMLILLAVGFILGR